MCILAIYIGERAYAKRRLIISHFSCNKNEVGWLIYTVVLVSSHYILLAKYNNTAGNYWSQNKNFSEFIF
jgi:hypothetical protein